ncbi:glycosyl hydrolase 115 family protein [Sphingomonas sp. 2R-10]|uniref:glycosyl hydrolase 115 family protein n=1 Tax=Sphingomonas sp. 2R-10 TaxID=3045148 RepID=UPI0019D2B294|nr:glycosyl hydrolase 115 family protein [Sphingomonas sp. 2R-10]MDJ0277566.1 glycosyl hydrolase 115 family protein [Sphingomonas sp. 2R-10]
MGRGDGMWRWLGAVAALAVPAAAGAQDAVLFDGRTVAGIVHDGSSSAGLAGALLARDLRQLTGRTTVVADDVSSCARLCVVIGTLDSALVRAVVADAGIDLSALDGTWERYGRMLVRSRRHPSRRYLLIAGSDRRGSVWGVVDLTRELGVSAWEWWADVTPRRVDRLRVDGALRLSASPSVQYRGIFLNDEDWGLQPWAAKTFEPQVGDIGPGTYARIFELMWRLKANLIWPAMHDSTTPFYQIPGNAAAARAHDIVVGTSHAEPMLRNNVREWDERVRGPFNFFTNRAGMIDYWRERVEAVKDGEHLYSIGLRGKHDSAMEGADTPEQARDATAQAIAVQRDLLARAQGRPAAQVPQALTLYKEVLDTYGAGLTVPDDVTLVWPDNNYGYIAQLPTPAEQARRGGSGVYYHLSYWGRPHDYLWLATTHPALVREQMDRAWQSQARKLWVVNVGDIKPGEYLTQYFLDLAFDHRTFAQAPRTHMRDWAARQFGDGVADRIAGLMLGYYDLAFERRPEFMGFSQVEPVTPVRTSEYLRSGGDEAERRLDRHAALVTEAEAIGATLPADRRDAFFQLILYPVRGAASLNERILKLDLAQEHAKALRAPIVPGSSSEAINRVGNVVRADMNALSEQARIAQQRIVDDTATYNALNDGKWRGMMNAAPRNLPVFRTPAFAHVPLPRQDACGIDGGDLAYVAGEARTRGFTLYSGGTDAAWSLAPPRGFVASATRGSLHAGNGYRTRIALSHDGSGSSGMRVTCGGRTLDIPIRIVTPANGEPPIINRIITLSPASATSPDWEGVPGFAGMLRSRLTLSSGNTATSPLTYRFDTDARGNADIRVVLSPTHPLTASHDLRLRLRVDGGALQTLDYATFGRSDEWKRNMLSNTAVRSVTLPQFPAGRHTLELFAASPGLLLDRIEVRLDGAPQEYGAPLR